MNEKYLDLFEKAKKASENAYCPYSKFKVGAVVVTEDEKRIHRL